MQPRSLWAMLLLWPVLLLCAPGARAQCAMTWQFDSPLNLGPITDATDFDPDGDGPRAPVTVMVDKAWGDLRVLDGKRLYAMPLSWQDSRDRLSRLGVWNSHLVNWSSRYAQRYQNGQWVPIGTSYPPVWPVMNSSPPLCVRVAGPGPSSGFHPTTYYQLAWWTEQGPVDVQGVPPVLMKGELADAYAIHGTVVLCTWYDAVRQWDGREWRSPLPPMTYTRLRLVGDALFAGSKAGGFTGSALHRFDQNGWVTLSGAGNFVAGTTGLALDEQGALIRWSEYPATDKGDVFGPLSSWTGSSWLPQPMLVTNPLIIPIFVGTSATYMGAHGGHVLCSYGTSNTRWTMRLIGKRFWHPDIPSDAFVATSAGALITHCTSAVASIAGYTIDSGVPSLSCLGVLTDEGLRPVRDGTGALVLLSVPGAPSRRPLGSIGEQPMVAQGRQLQVWNGQAFVAHGPPAPADILRAVQLADGSLLAHTLLPNQTLMAYRLVTSWVRVPALDTLQVAPMPNGQTLVYSTSSVSARVGTWNPTRPLDPVAWLPGTFAPAPGSTSGTPLINGLLQNGADLLVYGSFAAVSGQAMPYVAAWNGASWSPLSTGLSRATVQMLTHNGRLLALDSVLREWNGTAWVNPITMPWNAQARLVSRNGRLHLLGRLHDVTGIRLDAASAVLVPANSADRVGLGGAPGPDGQVTADDLLHFVNLFMAGSSEADIAGSGQLSSQGPTPDLQLTADDLLLYVSRFFLGC